MLTDGPGCYRRAGDLSFVATAVPPADGNGLARRTGGDAGSVVAQCCRRRAGNTAACCRGKISLIDWFCRILYQTRCSNLIYLLTFLMSELEVDSPDPAVPVTAIKYRPSKLEQWAWAKNMRPIITSQADTEHFDADPYPTFYIDVVLKLAT